MSVKPIPDGYHTITPYLLVTNVNGLIDFLERAFDAEVRGKHERSDGSVMHAEVKIGDSFVMMGEASGDFKPMPTMLHMYVENADETYARAVEAGGKSLREPSDQFYGDRSGGVEDASGNQWWISTHVEDVPPEEMERRQKEYEAQGSA